MIVSSTWDRCTEDLRRPCRDSRGPMNTTGYCCGNLEGPECLFVENAQRLQVRVFQVTATLLDSRLELAQSCLCTVTDRRG